jgi:general secretion pathway protein K
MKHHRALSPRRGAALLLAMIIVTLITTLAVSMVWQQWRATQVEAAGRARSQSGWILSGALDWATLILKEDRNTFDHPSDIWGTPLAEARLSTFLASDKENTEEGPDAFLSGSISDAQARFNLNNLVNTTTDQQISQDDLAALKRLCENVSVNPTNAQLIAEGLRDSLAPPGTAGVRPDPPLQPRRISQLTWLGVDAQALQRLEPFIIMLPVPTSINANTASREVIAAVANVDLAVADRLVTQRQRNPLKTPDEIRTQLQINAADPHQTKALNRLSTTTSFFEVRGRLRLDDRVLEQRSIVRRIGPRETRIIETERISSNDKPG